VERGRDRNFWDEISSDRLLIFLPFLWPFVWLLHRNGPIQMWVIEARRGGATEPRRFIAGTTREHRDKVLDGIAQLIAAGEPLSPSRRGG
jgi:hypothetical protein